MDQRTAFDFKLVSPESIFLERPVHMVVAPGIEGEFGVLKDHTAFLTTLEPGVIEIHNVKALDVSEDAGNDNVLPDIEYVFVSGGLADVYENTYTILADHITRIDDLNITELQQDKKALSEDLALVTLEGERKLLQKKIDILQAKITAAGHYQNKAA